MTKLSNDAAERPTEEPVMYVLARSVSTDLRSCNPGKMAAQVSHAATALVMNAAYQNTEALQNWSCGRGYGTTIVLGASLADILEFREQCMDANMELRPSAIYPWAVFTDPSYPFYVDPMLAEVSQKDVVCYRDKVNSDGLILATAPITTAAAVIGIPSALKRDVPILNQLSLHP